MGLLNSKGRCVERFRRIVKSELWIFVEIDVEFIFSFSLRTNYLKRLHNLVQKREEINFSKDWWTNLNTYWWICSTIFDIFIWKTFNSKSNKNVWNLIEHFSAWNHGFLFRNFKGLLLYCWKWVCILKTNNVAEWIKRLIWFYKFSFDLELWGSILRP